MKWIYTFEQMDNSTSDLVLQVTKREYDNFGSHLSEDTFDKNDIDIINDLVNNTPKLNDIKLIELIDNVKGGKIVHTIDEAIGHKNILISSGRAESEEYVLSIQKLDDRWYKCYTYIPFTEKEQFLICDDTDGLKLLYKYI